jgi:hypothetical protein
VLRGVTILNHHNHHHHPEPPGQVSDYKRHGRIMHRAALPLQYATHSEATHRMHSNRGPSHPLVNFQAALKKHSVTLSFFTQTAPLLYLPHKRVQ